MSTPAEIVPEIMKAIRLVSEGTTVTEAIDQCGLSYAQWYKWIKQPPIDAMLAEALQRGYDVLAEMLVNIDKYHADPQMANVISKNIQWFLARRKSQTYGDRIINEHHITADKEILEALASARERAQTITGVVLKALPHPTRAERLKDQEITDLVPDDLSDEDREALELAELY